jgi:cytochrome c-type biogenesis protein CcmH
MAMIQGMVEGLAARLERSPRDVEGWIKLIRSRTVLGELEAARQALSRALEVFDGAPQEQARIAAAGRDAGLMK